MRILIVHDRPEVGDEMRRVAIETASPGSLVESAVDVFGARDLLRDHYFDLVAVDLTLPIRHGRADASLQNAQLLLAEIFEGAGSKPPGDVLGISYDDKVLELVRTDIGEHIMGCIHQDAAGTWKDPFADKIRYVRRARAARQAVANSSHDFDVVVVTALDKEARPFAELFELTPSEDFDRARQFTFSSSDGRVRRGVLFAVGNSGQAPCGSATQALLTQFRPRLALMTGFCGGVKGKVNLGDVVAFRSSAPWDYGKWDETDENGTRRAVFQPRATALNVPDRGVRDVVRDLIEEGSWPGAELAARAAAEAGQKIAPRLRMQGAGSGSSVVTSEAVLGSIVAGDDSIWAVDMESYAFYLACRNTPVLPPDFMCIKAVADHCNGGKNSKLHGACSILSARLAHDLVRHRYRF